jgi:hypothetical protein
MVAACPVSRPRSRLGNVQDRLPVSTDPPVRTSFEASTYLAVQMLPRLGLHHTVTRERLEQADVLIRRVAALPEIAPDLRVLEESTRFDFG